MCKRTLFTLTVLALASLTAFAATKEGIVLSKDGRTVTTTNRTPSVKTTVDSDAGLTTISGNLGTAYPKGAYWCCEGATIFGPTAVSGAPEYWEAAAFTPKHNRTVTKVKVAVGYVEGTNSLVLALYSDDSGVPGTAIKTWTISNLPTFGSCCAVETKSDGAGVPVTAGTQYWIVLKTNKKSSDTFAAWNVNDTDQIDSVPTAFWCSADKGGSCGSSNDVWTPGESVPGLAFAVLGN